MSDCQEALRRAENIIARLLISPRDHVAKLLAEAWLRDHEQAE